MKKIRVCNCIAYVLLVCLILAVSPFVLPKLFGIEPYGILSNSMEPSYPIGSVVYVKKCQSDAVSAGDVITFSLSVQNENVATHRIVEKDDQQQVFITKGDHNQEIDATPVSYQRLIGKVALCVPMLGTFYMWLVSATGIAVCTFSLCMVILLWYFVGKWKKERNGR